MNQNQLQLDVEGKTLWLNGKSIQFAVQWTDKTHFTVSASASEGGKPIVMAQCDLMKYGLTGIMHADRADHLPLLQALGAGEEYMEALFQKITFVCIKTGDRGISAR